MLDIGSFFHEFAFVLCYIIILSYRWSPPAVKRVYEACFVLPECYAKTSSETMLDSSELHVGTSLYHVLREEDLFHSMNCSIFTYKNNVIPVC